MLSLIAASCKSPEKHTSSPPIILDNRLTLELITEHPDLVTPIGLAIDPNDNIYILESHTHLPLKDYDGPKFDRVKKGIDKNKDGRPESWIVFADSIEDGMNLFWGPENTLYLTEKNSVKTFRDTNGDGVSDESKTLLRMVQPKDVYDHAGVMGICISPDNWLYVSRGNTGGQAWRIEGTDGSFIEGYGDGGNLFRCRLDGSQLEEIATGFWNPFDIKFSANGRLMLVDNDPDSRGPNRLLEVVQGGDYGYKSLYGGSGIHPFLAWNGELPGTLPYAAAIGEAPSGVIDATYSNFPQDYAGNMLVTVWEEHTIVRVPLSNHYSSVKGEAQIIVNGDSTFHPVALAANSRGEIYITDWVVRQYPVHGQGRLWRLTSGENKPLAEISPPPSSSDIFNKRYESLQTFEQINEALQSEDVFLQTVARKKLSANTYTKELSSLINNQEGSIRLQALLTFFQSSATPDKPTLQKLLSDEHEEIRRMALIYIASKSRMDLLPDVKQSLQKGSITPPMLETWLATISHLNPEFVDAYRTKAKPYAKSIEQKLPEGIVFDILKNKNLSPAMRAAAVPFLENVNQHTDALLTVLNNSPVPVQDALLQTFKKINHEEAARSILQIALDINADIEMRAQAVTTLQYQSANLCKEILPLLESDNEILKETTVRYLCRCRDEALSNNIEKHMADQAGNIKAIWNLCTGSEKNEKSEEQWAALADREGNPAKGKFVFQSPRAQCQTCHKVDGWGGEFGPDLSHIGSSKTQEQLITAILRPSAEISPEWQGWFVTTQEGETVYGRQIDVGFKDVEIMLPSGEFETYKNPLKYGMAPSSLMPEGLEANLTEDEFNDLIAYLVSLK